MQAIIHGFGGLIVMLIKLVAGAGVLVFMWGLAMFIFKSGDSKSHEEGRNRMVWGIITLFVMFSVWAIISVLNQDILGAPVREGWDTLPGYVG